MNNKGFTLVEILVVTLIFSFIVAGTFMTMHSGQEAWRQDETQIQLQDDMRQAIARISSELRLSGSYSDQSITCPATHNTTLYVGVTDAGGMGTTDVITFSIPVVCESTGSIMDANGNVAYWRAPLTWGCTDSSCMDADDNCATNDYDEIEYRVRNDSNLVRRVLQPDGTVVRTDIIARDVTDFQATLNSVEICQVGSGLTSSSAINIDIQMSRRFIASDNNSRLISVDDSVDIAFRNLGEDVL